MVSDFSDCLDITMMEGLQRFEHPAEYSVYTELYHVLWLDRHWNQLLEVLEKEVQLEEDKVCIERYFSKCFLELTENFKLLDSRYSPAFFEILSVKISSLRDMIGIAKKVNSAVQNLLMHRQSIKKNIRLCLINIRNNCWRKNYGTS